MSDICISCNTVVTPRQHAVSCDVCDRWQHRICGTGISQAQYFSARREDLELKFVCQPCVVRIPPRDNDGVEDFTLTLALSIAACTLGSSFQFGYNTGIVNAPEKVFRDFFNSTYHDRHNGTSYLSKSSSTILWSVTVSIYCVGGMLGGVSAGHWANRWGRKGTLLKNNIITTLAVAIEVSSYYTKSYEVLIVGRFVMGISSGINTGLAPMYLAEIAPVSLRGLCGVFNQLSTTFGVFISAVIGLKEVLGREHTWQFALGFSLIPVVWQLISLYFCPETPRYLLITKHQEEEAEKALQWLRKREDVSDEIDEMIAERELAKHIKKFTFKDLVTNPDLKKPLIISLVMHLSQQLSGINAVIYYSTSIFIQAGLKTAAAQYATLATGFVNVCMTFVSALIMDRVGRRTLHLTGLGGMFIASYILAVGLIFQTYYEWLSYICVISVTCYIISFATGPGSIPWFYVAELFSQGPRSTAVSVATAVNWSANFTVGLVFPILNDEIKQYSFIPFVVLLAIFWLYTFFRVPETKGLTIEQITQSFKVDSFGQYQRLQQDNDR